MLEGRSVSELRMRLRRVAPASYWCLVALSVVLMTVPAFPGGDVAYEDDSVGGILPGVLLWGLLLAFIARGSGRAWMLMTILAAMSVVGVVGGGLGFGVPAVDGIVFEASIVGSFGCLVAPSLRAHVRRRA
jgi:hypothetical protein